MTDTRKLKFKINMVECTACDGWHAHWWLTSSVPPPSCMERQKRKAR